MTKINNNIPKGDTLSLPKGYKNSPLGIIPEEWEVKRLGEFSQKISNFSFSRAQLSNSEQRLRYVHYGDIHVNSEQDCVDLTKDELPFLLDNLIETERIDSADFPLLQNGDIIFADASEDYEGIGNCWEIHNTNGFDVISGLHTIPIRCSKEFVSIGFGRYLLKNKKSALALRIIAHGTKVYSLSYNNMSKLKVALPPLPEQQKIAEILSTWDVAIEKQQALIAQLLLRKRALMQKLLTGKLRLRSETGERFSGEWKKVKLGELCEITTGKVDANAMRADGKFPFFTCAKEVYRIDKFFFDTEALLVSGNGEHVGYVHYCKGKFNAYQRTYVLDEFSENIFFLKYALQFHLPERINKTKSNSNTPYIVISSLTDMSLKLPSLPEQTAIAEVLSTADRHIEIEQQKLAHLREQKKGLMQVLLSGRKRVRI